MISKEENKEKWISVSESIKKAEKSEPLLSQGNPKYYGFMTLSAEDTESSPPDVSKEPIQGTASNIDSAIISEPSVRDISSALYILNSSRLYQKMTTEENTFSKTETTEPVRLDDIDMPDSSVTEDSLAGTELEDISFEIESEDQSTSDNTTQDQSTASKNEDDMDENSLDEFVVWLNSLKPKKDTADTKKAEKQDASFTKSKDKTENEQASPSDTQEKNEAIKTQEPMSVPLALLLAEQGYPGKAKKMLQQLSAREPEKKTYFADLIQKIEE